MPHTVLESFFVQSDSEEGGDLLCETYHRLSTTVGRLADVSFLRCQYRRRERRRRLRFW